MSRKTDRLKNIQEANRRVLSEQVIHDVDEALRIARENGTVVVSADVVHNKMRTHREPNLSVYIVDGEIYKTKENLHGPDAEYGDQTITHVPKEEFSREINDKISTYQGILNRLG